MDSAVKETLNQILDYIGGCEDFRNNAQLRTYLERLTAQKEPVAESPLQCGVIKQLFQTEINALEEEIKIWGGRNNWRAATEAKDKLRGIQHMLMKLQYNRIAL